MPISLLPRQSSSSHQRLQIGCAPWVEALRLGSHGRPAARLQGGRWVIRQRIGLFDAEPMLYQECWVIQKNLEFTMFTSKLNYVRYCCRLDSSRTLFLFAVLRQDLCKGLNEQPTNQTLINLISGMITIQMQLDSVIDPWSQLWNAGMNMRSWRPKWNR